MATLLIVDPNPDDRRPYITLLGNFGYRLLEAQDGVQALEVARAELPDLIISDILMPSMDGFTLVRRLSKEPLLLSVQIAPSELARLTQIDYEREMAFIATIAGADGQPETIGTVRAVTDSDNARAEFGLIVRSDMKGRGLGLLLLKKMIRYCRERGTGEMFGDVLHENAGMLKLARALGFEVLPDEENGFLHLGLALQPAPAAGEKKRD